MPLWGPYLVQFLICCPSTGEPGGSNVTCLQSSGIRSITNIGYPPTGKGRPEPSSNHAFMFVPKRQVLKIGIQKRMSCLQEQPWNKWMSSWFCNFVTSFACQHSMWSDSFAITHPAALLRSRTHLQALRDSCCGQWPLQDLFCRTRRRRQSHFFVYISNRCIMWPGTFLEMSWEKILLHVLVEEWFNMLKGIYNPWIFWFYLRLTSISGTVGYLGKHVWFANTSHISYEVWMSPHALMPLPDEYCWIWFVPSGHIAIVCSSIYIYIGTVHWLLCKCFLICDMGPYHQQPMGTYPSANPNSGEHSNSMKPRPRIIHQRPPTQKSCCPNGINFQL